MREIERYCAGTQKYIDSEIKQVKTGNLAYATVRDGFNREHEPHLHTHVVVANLTQYGDKMMALDGRQIMRQDFNKMWGAMYRANLASYLKEAGHSVSYTKKGELRLDSVSLEVEREFSKRAAQIEAAMKEGLGHMDAWRKTRREKEPAVGKEGVLADWKERLGRYEAKTVEQNRADGVAAREAWVREAKFSVEARQELAGERGDSEIARWQAAARRATEQTAAASANMLITEYLTEVARGEAWAPITYAEAEQRLRSEVQAGRLLATDDGRFTTWEMTRADRECVRDRQAPAALALRPEEAAAQVAEYVKKNEAAGLRGLSEQQAAAAAGILSAERGTVVVQGDAGAGKTTMLRAVNEIAGGAGWETVGLAIQGVAARKLQEESGIGSTTVSSYLARERAVSRVEPGEALAERAPRLIVIDEASMNDSRGLAELMRQADKHGDKIVLVGDRNQIQSVGAGRPFDRLVTEAQDSGRLLSLSENFRQRDPQLREAVNLARDGHMRESIDVLARSGSVAEIADTQLRRLAVASHYGKDTLIMAGSRESRDALNGLIRDDLAKRGAVDRTTAITYKLSWTDADGVKQAVRRELAVGDVVTFLDNDYRKGLDVRNGERGEVLKTAKNGLTMRLEDGRTVEVDTQRYGALDYGYALTTYKSQGQTFNKVVVEADTSAPQLQDQRNTYVQITRARDEVKIITDDKAGLREAAGVLNYKTDTFGIKATLEKAAAMERRVHAEAFGGRAPREAEAKLAPEQALAKRDAENVAGAVNSMRPPSPTPEVHGERLAADALRVSPAERVERLRDINAELEARADLSGRDKALTGEYLNSDKGARALERLKEPAEAIAAGLVKSGVMTLKEAVKDLPPDQKMNVDKFVRAPEIVKEVAREEVRASFPGNPSAPIIVKNESFMAGAGRSTTFMHGYERHLDAVTQKLRESPMLNDAQRRAVAAELEKPVSADALLATIGRPERAVAFGVVRSGATTLPAADVKPIAGLLEKAAAVDRNVRDADLELRARLEAGAKIVQAQGAAKRDGDIAAPRPPYSPPEPTHVNNPLFVACGRPEEQAARTERLREIDKALQARVDLSDGEKGWTGKFLNSAEAVKTLERFQKPEEVIAVGLVKARVMDIKEAVKDLPEKAGLTVRIHVKNQEIETGRSLEKERGKDLGKEHGKGRGLDLSM
jgi:ATP-dependent exoDNAse (exonuclease V) alpha subunit